MPDIVLHLAVATGLGLLVGLQREWAKQGVVGIRTFPLITVLGAVAAILAGTWGGWVVAAGLLAVASVLYISDLGLVASGRGTGGMTTEVSALVMYGVGALSIGDTQWLALVVTGLVMALLQFKSPLHEFVDAMRAAEVRGVAQLALLGLVVLPVLPDRHLGPYDVVNPREAWTMVVLIVGISLAGHATRRAFGDRAGVVAAGLLGGLISSTATTVSEARRVGEQGTGAATVVIVLATVVSFARLLLEIAIVAPSILPTAGPPLGLMLGVAALCGAVTAWLLGRQGYAPIDADDATDLVGAMVFGLLYVGALVVVAWTQDRFGTTALYAVGFLSGLTDVDAITLSISNLATEGTLASAVAWRVILLAAMSNTLFKLGIAAVLGSPGLAGRAALALAPAVLTGTVLFLWWPA